MQFEASASACSHSSASFVTFKVDREILYFCRQPFEVDYSVVECLSSISSAPGGHTGAQRLIGFLLCSPRSVRFA